jgi:hypothetical protein
VPLYRDLGGDGTVSVIPEKVGTGGVIPRLAAPDLNRFRGIARSHNSTRFIRAADFFFCAKTFFLGV